MTALEPARTDHGDGLATRRLRVLVVGKGAPDRGGIAAFIATLVASPLARRHALTVLNLTRPQRAPAGRASLANLVRTLADAGRVWRRARGHDLVHLQTALVPHVTLARAGLLALAARSRGAAVVVHVHNGQVAGWFDRPLRRLLGRLALAPARRVATVDRASRAALAELSAPARVELVDNGVPVQRYRPAVANRARAAPRVLFAGVLTPRKGAVDLTRASQILRARGVAHELVLVGGTPDEGSVAEAAVREAAAAAGAACPGALPHEQMPAVLAEADVFCLPSWWEATPLSVLEAMAAGLPVVATAVGDVGRLVVDGTTGLLVPPRDVEALAAALETLLIDAALRRRLGAAGRRRVVARFDLPATADAVDGLYRRALGA